MAEGAPFAPRRDTNRSAQIAQIAGVCAVAAVVCLGLVSNTQSPVELFAPRTLTPQEKAFVARAASTPNTDMSKAKKLPSDAGLDDMDKFYDQQAKKINVINSRAHQHLKQLKGEANTAAVRTQINHYFDKQLKIAKVEHAKINHKEAGSGAAARAKMNLYFKHLNEAEGVINKKDDAKLRAEPVFHSKHGTAIAAMKDINSYFDQLAVKEKKEDEAYKAKHPVKQNAYDFLTPDAAAKKHKGEAVHVHKHDEEGIQESTQQSRGDIDSYFDDLDRTERLKDEADRAGLDQHRQYAAPAKKLSTADSNHDLDHYFKSLKKTYSGKDQADVARLRKDSAKVNWHEGVNLAKHPLPKKVKEVKKGAVKEEKEGKKGEKKEAEHKVVARKEEAKAHVQAKKHA